MKDGLKEGIEIPRDHFKDLDLSTYVPTPQGWRTLGEIHKGDFVFAIDGTPTKVIGESPIFENNECYEITFSTGEKVTCGAGHLWTVDERRRALNDSIYTGPFVKTTEELAKDYILKTRIEPTTGKQYNEANYKIQVAAPAQYPEQVLSLAPYILGCWLGDGNSDSAGYTTKDTEILDTFKEFGYKVSHAYSKYQYRLLGDVEAVLRSLRLLGNKHIPSMYLQSSEEQRWHLLSGLMDTDGTVNKEGQCSFVNKNPELIYQVRELMCSLGIKASSVMRTMSYLGKKEVSKECGYVYTITFYPNGRVPFFLERKASRCRDYHRTPSRTITAMTKVPSIPTKCISVEAQDGLFLITESFIPTHNSTVYSECFPIWRALPFGHREEDFFTSVGYSDLYIEWMRRTHSQDIRILLVSETIKNAIKLGTRISNHYENNAFFRHLFPEIMPTEKETWTNESLHQRRTPSGRGQGEGTFDFIGVGAALQSRHYSVVVQDDLVGREARKSSIVMADTIDYHQILVGATDRDPNNPGKDFDEIVVGNRWSHDDLNSHIRKEEPYFNWTTHSALGGCCDLHPFGEPIFPEEWTKELLLRWKRRLGSYHFSCQFLNYPIDPSKAKFNMGDFRYFHFEKVTGALAIPKESATMAQLFETTTPQQYRIVVRHHVSEGDVEKDVFPRNLDRYMVVDPNHGGSHMGQEVGKDGRCRHAIAVTGVSRNPRRVYLLDQWAKACPIDQFVERLFFYAVKWKLRVVYVEAVAAQKYLLYHLNYFVEQHKHTRPEIAGIQFLPLKTPQNVNAKAERIENFIPIVERHELWLDANNCVETKEEAEQYGQRKGLIDLLDVLSYGPQVWKFDTVSEEKINDFMSKQMALYRRRVASAAA
jgi:Fe-S-cluster containining protein